MRKDHPEVWDGDRHLWFSQEEWNRRYANFVDGKSAKPKLPIYALSTNATTNVEPTHISRTNPPPFTLPDDAKYLGCGTFIGKTP